MLFYRLILCGMILMNKNTLYNTVSCQDVSMILSRTVLFQQEKLRIGCSPSEAPMWVSITNVTLEKNTSNGFQNIVTVYFDLKSMQNATAWTRTGWQNRATVIKEYIYPIMNSGLAFDIPPENVLCSDEGVFRCTVIGTSAKNQLLEKVKIGTVELIVRPTTIHQIQVSPKPEMDETYNPYTLIQLSCTGTVGAPAQVLRWCFRRENDKHFRSWLDNGDIDQGPVFPQGCQNSQTSTLGYNVSADFQYTEFICETGGTSTICGHASSISSNITIYKYTVPTRPTYVTSIETTECSSEREILLLGCTIILLAVVIIGFIISVTFYKKEYTKIQ
ncbi:uncharacterized protein LOC127700609 isoform X2 [Mytilus californianus]|uniref:uncharacterized protein LOC127700609 isoform X2 n=1 Tax=Mytilus californianus TaxID=6549 RepID=UPI0022460F91|nr:uncharacterized protein LOC127700609 isoform X2 [Mytilus californianus]